MYSPRTPVQPTASPDTLSLLRVSPEDQVEALLAQLSAKEEELYQAAEIGSSLLTRNEELEAKVKELQVTVEDMQEYHPPRSLVEKPLLDEIDALKRQIQVHETKEAKHVEEMGRASAELTRLYKVEYKLSEEESLLQKERNLSAKLQGSVVRLSTSLLEENDVVRKLQEKLVTLTRELNEEKDNAASLANELTLMEERWGQLHHQNQKLRSELLKEQRAQKDSSAKLEEAALALQNEQERNTVLTSENEDLQQVRSLGDWSVCSSPATHPKPAFLNYRPAVAVTNPTNNSTEFTRVLDGQEKEVVTPLSQELMEVMKSIAASAEKVRSAKERDETHSETEGDDMPLTPPMPPMTPAVGTPDAEFEFFTLTCLSVKISQGFFDNGAGWLETEAMYERCQSQHIPFHEWHDWIGQQVDAVRGLHQQASKKLETSSPNPGMDKKRKKKRKEVKSNARL
jgi:hypothetical protein